MRQVPMVIVLLGLGVALVLWHPTREYSEFCTLDAPLAQLPAGWEFHRDNYNGCAMTLFDAYGNRAPKELYAEVPVDSPPDYPKDWDNLGWVMIIGAIGTGVVSSSRQRKQAERQSSRE